MKRRAFLSTMAIGASGIALGQSARADEVADTLAEISRARSSLTTMVATFTQERTIDLLATVVKSEGELTLVRPDRLRWELKPPDAITYWITPAGLAYATPTGHASVGRSAAGRFGAVLTDLMTLLGGDLEKLRARYDLAVTRRTDGVLLTAQPRAAEVKKHVKRLMLSIAPDLWTVRSITIEEATGDKSVIAFIKTTRDAKVDPAIMTPPAPR